MVSSAVPKLLKEKTDFFRQDESNPIRGEGSLRFPKLAFEVDQPQFLRIPPFPGARVKRFAVRSVNADSSDLTDEIRRLRVGGAYWGVQPDLPVDFVLLRSAAALGVTCQLNGSKIVLWERSVRLTPPADRGVSVVNGDCDPWHMVSSASSVVVEDDDEVRVIAAILGVRRYLFDSSTGRIELDTTAAASLLASALSGAGLEDPFTGELMEMREAVSLCGFWRALIDSNREIEAGLGFAFWKRSHSAPLLWGGSKHFPFVNGPAAVRAGGSVAVWRSAHPIRARCS